MSNMFCLARCAFYVGTAFKLGQYVSTCFRAISSLIGSQFPMLGCSSNEQVDLF